MSDITGLPDYLCDNCGAIDPAIGQKECQSCELEVVKADLASANAKLEADDRAWHEQEDELQALRVRLAAKPDVAGLVDAYDEARYHFEDWTGGADTPSKQAELKRRVDAKDAARQRIQDALLSLSAQLAEKEAECEGLRQDAERYRYLRSIERRECLILNGPAAGCWIDCEAEDGTLQLLTAEDADAAIDAAIAAREKPNG